MGKAPAVQTDLSPPSSTHGTTRPSAAGLPRSTTPGSEDKSIYGVCGPARLAELVSSGPSETVKTPNTTTASLHGMSICAYI